jgi:hypothetical protein
MLERLAADAHLVRVSSERLHGINNNNFQARRDQRLWATDKYRCLSAASVCLQLENAATARWWLSSAAGDSNTQQKCD